MRAICLTCRADIDYLEKDQVGKGNEFRCVKCRCEQILSGAEDKVSKLRERYEAWREASAAPLFETQPENPGAEDVPPEKRKRRQRRAAGAVART